VRILVVNQDEVGRLLPMGECMDVMAEVLRTLGRGEALLPLRTIVHLPGGLGEFAVMPSYLARPAAIGLKAITVFPRNEGTAYDSHQGAVLLFDVEHGSLVALMDASSITAIRTAAVSGVATRVLARPDAGDLALLGTGVQALTHLEAMLLARPLTRVRAWSRSPDNVARFAAAASRRFGVAVEAAKDARAAVEGASLICTTTSAHQPILEGAWIAPGAHVNAVGSSIRTARELDTAAMKRAALFVDRRESALAEAGDFLIARNEGAFGDEHILGEVGDVLLSRHPGRTSAEQVTVFKSLGLSVEDVASAHLIHAAAVRGGLGTWIELGGERRQ
jgi:ornithine cyclodeaminase/alanine dehydrogenase-like protein (mu-crystallin family)